MRKTPSSPWIQPVLSDRSSYPRHTNFPLPAYRYLPGVNPHPFRSDEGHSRQKRESPHSPAETYLYGVDLWNHAYWWECHEMFEALWKAAPPKSPERLFLQGWIQFAAACIQWTLGQHQGARTLLKQASVKWQKALLNRPKILGVALHPTLKKLSLYFQPLRDSESPENPLKDYPLMHIPKAAIPGLTRDPVPLQSSFLDSRLRGNDKPHKKPFSKSRT